MGSFQKAELPLNGISRAYSLRGPRVWKWKKWEKEKRMKSLSKTTFCQISKNRPRFIHRLPRCDSLDISISLLRFNSIIFFGLNSDRVDGSDVILFLFFKTKLACDKGLNQLFDYCYPWYFTIFFSPVSNNPYCFPTLVQRKKIVPAWVHDTTFELD